MLPVMRQKHSCHPATPDFALDCETVAEKGGQILRNLFEEKSKSLRCGAVDQ
jgi:hypothetical protein